MSEFFIAIEALNDLNAAKSGKPKIKHPTKDEVAQLMERYGQK